MVKATTARTAAEWHNTSCEDILCNLRDFVKQALVAAGIIDLVLENLQPLKATRPTWLDVGSIKAETD